MKIEFVNLPSELNEHIYSFVQYQTARENYNKVIEQIKNSYYSQITNINLSEKYQEFFNSQTYLEHFWQIYYYYMCYNFLEYMHHFPKLRNLNYWKKITNHESSKRLHFNFVWVKNYDFLSN